MSDISISDIRDKVCRLCLEENKKLAHLENLFFDENCFLDIIQDCYALEINLDQDHLPLLICKKCVTTTLNFYAFKNTVIENEVFLQSIDIDKVEHNPKMDQNLNQNITEVRQIQTEINVFEVKNTNEQELVQEEEEETSLTESSDNISLLKFKPLQPYSQSLAHEQTCNTDGKVKTQSVQLKAKEKLEANGSISESGYACSICTSFYTIQGCKNDEDSMVCAHAKYKATNIDIDLKEMPYEKGYVCTTCKRNFPTPNCWKKHVISHYSAQKYHCLQCNESFGSKHELVVHTYTHLYKNGENGNKQAFRNIRQTYK